MIRVLDEARSVGILRHGLRAEGGRPAGFRQLHADLSVRTPSSTFEVELTVNKGRTEPYNLGDGYGHLAVSGRRRRCRTRPDDGCGPCPPQACRLRPGGQRHRPLLLHRGPRWLPDRGLQRGGAISEEGDGVRPSQMQGRNDMTKHDFRGLTRSAASVAQSRPGRLPVTGAGLHRRAERRLGGRGDGDHPGTDGDASADGARHLPARPGAGPAITPWRSRAMTAKTRRHMVAAGRGEHLTPPQKAMGHASYLVAAGGRRTASRCCSPSRRRPSSRRSVGAW